MSPRIVDYGSVQRENLLNCGYFSLLSRVLIFGMSQVKCQSVWSSIVVLDDFYMSPSQVFLPYLSSTKKNYDDHDDKKKTIVKV